jgi:hypothetical protein
MVNVLTEANNSPKEKAFYPNFFPQAQRDFATRMKWSVTPKFTGANHQPTVRVEGPLNIMASAGEKLRLNGFVSDPDGNKVSVKWWQFQGGTTLPMVNILNPNSLQTEIQIPKEALTGQSIHLILEANDNGTPELTSYQRVIITIRK